MTPTKKMEFDDFLRNPSVYQECVSYWSQLLDDAARLAGQSTWSTRLPEAYVNGTPLSERGNPLIIGLSPDNTREFRIIQNELEGANIDFSAWVSRGDPEYDILSREELVISLGLTETTAKAAKKLLVRWMSFKDTPEQMSSYIAAEWSNIVVGEN